MTASDDAPLPVCCQYTDAPLPVSCQYNEESALISGLMVLYWPDDTPAEIDAFGGAFILLSGLPLSLATFRLALTARLDALFLRRSTD